MAEDLMANIEITPREAEAALAADKNILLVMCESRGNTSARTLRARS